jgi:hypothetical protein
MTSPIRSRAPDRCTPVLRSSYRSRLAGSWIGRSLAPYQQRLPASHTSPLNCAASCLRAVQIHLIISTTAHQVNFLNVKEPLYVLPLSVPASASISARHCVLLDKVKPQEWTAAWTGTAVPQGSRPAMHDAQRDADWIGRRQRIQRCLKCVVPGRQEGRHPIA